MDVEYAEFYALPQILHNHTLDNVSQMGVEIHLWRHGKEQSSSLFSSQVKWNSTMEPMSLSIDR